MPTDPRSDPLAGLNMAGCDENARVMAVEAVAGERARLQVVVNEQAEDEGLWFVAQTAPEAYLQQELRRLHAAIEEADDAGAWRR